MQFFYITRIRLILKKPMELLGSVTFLSDSVKDNFKEIIQNADIQKIKQYF